MGTNSIVGKAAFAVVLEDTSVSGFYLIPAFRANNNE